MLQRGVLAAIRIISLTTCPVEISRCWFRDFFQSFSSSISLCHTFTRQLCSFFPFVRFWSPFIDLPSVLSIPFSFVGFLILIFFSPSIHSFFLVRFCFGIPCISWAFCTFSSFIFFPPDCVICYIPESVAERHSDYTIMKL